MPPLSQAGLPYSQGLKYHLRVDAQICITSLALSPTSEAPVELSAWRFTRTSLHLCRYKKEFLLILYSAGLSSHTPNLSERYQHQQSPRVHSACGNYCRTVPRREAGEHKTVDPAVGTGPVYFRNSEERTEVTALDDGRPGMVAFTLSDTGSHWRALSWG